MKRLLFWLLVPFVSIAAFAAGDAGSAEALRALHAAKTAALANSPLQRPLLLYSSELPHGLQGELFGVIEQPLAALRSAFESPARWCEVLLLHVNNRRCRLATVDGQQQITLSIVRRYDKPVADAFELPFSFRVVDASPDYLEVRLTAAAGPLGTRNYTILLEATALDNKRSFVHFSYAYEQNTMVALAVQAYLATFGSHKVGFTEVAPGSTDGKTRYIAGPRGLVERNAMRYFLTLEAYLGAADPEARRQAWFDATERYPRQLREAERDTYLALKRADTQKPAP